MGARGANAPPGVVMLEKNAAKSALLDAPLVEKT